MADGKDTIYDWEKRLWAAADELRANSKLKSSEYSRSIQSERLIGENERQSKDIVAMLL